MAHNYSFFYRLWASGYEHQAFLSAGGLLMRLLGTRRWGPIDAKPRGGPSELSNFLSQYPVPDLGEAENAVVDQEYKDALRVDLVYQFELAGGESLLAVGEASITVAVSDVERARRRAAAIGEITGTATLPFVIGAAIGPDAAEEAEKPGEAPVRWLQMDERPERE